jgi:hypothetical protein
MNTTKLMRQTANALRVYRLASNNGTDMQIVLYLSEVFDGLLEKMVKQQKIEFHSEAIKILNEMISNYDYE